MKLKTFFKEQFQSPIEEAKVEVFTFREILQHLDIDDNIKDELEGINKIIHHLKTNTAIFFDETPIVRTDVDGEATDWTGLRLRNDQKSIYVTISFQPLIESVQKNLKPVKPMFPKNASILELNRVYRSSNSIFKCVQRSIQYENGIKRLDCEASSNELVTGTGREPIVVSYRPPYDVLIKLWVQEQITKMKWKSDKMTILYTLSTEEDALRMFTDSFPSSLAALDEFRGCENSVVICFYSSDDDETWQLMAMASRAQQILIIINKIIEESKSAFTEITHARHYDLGNIMAEVDQKKREFIAMENTKIWTFKPGDNFDMIRTWVEDQSATCKNTTTTIICTKTTEQEAKVIFNGYSLNLSLKPLDRNWTKECTDSVLIWLCSSEDEFEDLLRTASTNTQMQLFIILGMYQENIHHFNFEDLVNAPSFLFISTTGPSADHQGHIFGLYKKSDQMGFYVQEHDMMYGDIPCKLFSYIMSSPWNVIDKDGQTRLRAKVKSKSPTTVDGKWEYYDFDSRVRTWYDDPHVTAISLKEKPTECEVTIKLKDKSMLFLADGYCRGRQVLHHTDGEMRLRLYVNETGLWVASWVDDDNFLMSRSAPSMCPADPRAARETRRGETGWRYWSKRRGGAWVRAEDILVTCSTHIY